MRPLIFTKSFTVLAVALGALATGSLAHAHSDIRFSIGVQVPGILVQPLPRHVQLQPFYQPAPDYYRRLGAGQSLGGPHWQHRSPYGDLDRDGIMNRQDRDRDGDGVRNRYDRHPNNPFRR